ncbi:hypothetical protein CP082626L3_1496B, partial [Chlamydia psittaci 08-2626_L3]
KEKSEKEEEQPIKK